MNESNRTSLAALFHAVGDPIELCRVEVPAPSDHEAIVRIQCATLCGSDRYTVLGQRDEPLPTILGHEAIGHVEQLGDVPPRDVDGNELVVGDRVTWSCAVSCFDCDRCEDGLPQKCRSLAKYGHSRAEGRTLLSGGLAERILIRAGSSLVKLDSDLPSEVACPANCATATVAAAIRHAGNLAGKRIIILGGGMLGLTATAMAATLAARSIMVVDPVPERLTLARRFGATDGAATISATSTDSRFDVVLEFSGAVSAVETAVAIADVGASIVLVGSVAPSPPVAIDPEQWVRRCLSMHGVHNYRPDDLKTAVDFLHRHHTRYPLASLVERTFDLADVQGAIDCLVHDRPIRVAVVPAPSRF